VTDVFCENSNKGVQALAKERTDPGRRLTHSRQDYADGKIDGTDWLATRKRIKSRNEEIQHKIDRLQSDGALRQSGIYQRSDRRGSAGDSTQRRALLNAMIDRIEVAPHPKGVQTHPVSADLIASRLDIRWLA
jgi:hypothetical protein